MAFPHVFLFLLLWLAVVVGFCGCFVDSVADIAQQTTLDFQSGCAETAQFASDKAHAMADWTYDQILQYYFSPSLLHPLIFLPILISLLYFVSSQLSVLRCSQANLFPCSYVMEPRLTH